MKHLQPYQQRDFKGFIELHIKTLGDPNSRKFKEKYLEDHPGLMSTMKFFGKYRRQRKHVVSCLIYIFSVSSCLRKATEFHLRTQLWYTGILFK
jgi:hypothetical protein